MSFSNFKIEPLCKDNFDTWKIQVEALLIKNDEWKYVNGTFPKPETSPADASLWESEDAKAKADLILLISTTELKQVKNCKTSKDVWDKLHSIYQSKGPARKAMLLKNLILLKMKNGDDVRDHIRKFFDIVDKIHEMEMEIIDDLLVILLLYSIPDEYESFRIAIETQEKLPSPEILKIKLLEEYEARKRNVIEEPLDVMMAEKKNKKQFKSNEYQKKFIFSCHNCGKKGHKAKDCWSNGKNQKRYVNKSQETTRAANVALHVNKELKYWCLDSGASSHMCSEKSKFSIFKMSSEILQLANNESTKIEGKGIVEIKSETGHTLELQEVLYVPDLRSNLLSVSKITDHGFEVKFNRKKAVVKNPRTGEHILIAKRNKDLYYVEEIVQRSKLIEKSNIQEWHERYGHLNENDLKDLLRKGMVNGIDFNINENLQSCEACIKGKQSQKPFKRSTIKSTELLELIHTDVCGPMRVNSIGGSKYFLTFIDDKSRWCEIYFLKKKSEVFEKFKEFKSMVERRTNLKIKTLRSDNGTEYTNNEFKNYLKNEGIKHEFSVEYTPQQNGVAERKNRTLIEMARCMMINAGLSQQFWAEAVLTANHIRNRCPSRSLNGETPFKIWTGRKPTVKYFQKFGTIGYILIKNKNLSKFEARSKRCIFVGYSINSKAYRLWDEAERKIVCSRDVKFTNKFKTEKGLNNYETEIPQKSYIELKFSPKENTKNNVQRNIEICEESEEEFYGFSESNDETQNEEIIESFETPLTSKRGPGRPKKIKTGKRGRPRKLLNTIQSADIEKPNYIANLADESDPLNPSEAFSSSEAEEWKKAMKSEYDALIKNDTWSLVNYPQNKRVVDCKWVLRKKYKSDGTIERYKARLVAKGFTQISGIDYNETFSPVARISSIRLLMALSAKLKLDIYQLDFVTAYLNGDIEETIYMKVPDEIEMFLEDNEKRKYEGKACLLKKALYGLKQSGRQWYKKLDDKLKQMKFRSLNSDNCIYILKEDAFITLIAIYVDDLIIATNNKQKWEKLKSELAKTFKMKDLNRLSFCLGIEFNQDPYTKEITMKQEKYIQNILKKFNMEECKSAKTPFNTGIKLSKEMCATEEEKPEIEKLPYKNLVGSLMYLAVSTRPDIAHAVSVLSQFNTNYGKEHWIAAKRVLRYLKGTQDFGLHYKTNNEQLTGYADADWGANIDDRRSYTGYVFKLSNAAISWDSRKQRTVAMSTTEAEYMALSECTKEAIHLRTFLKEIVGNQNSTLIYNDNQGARLLSMNPVFHNKTKHMDIRHHFVRENVIKENIKIEYLPTEEMPADILTKGLASTKHYKCISQIGLLSIVK